jgi:DNA helicase-2/ATP-dependent DNA helicase PcrA
MTVHAAKGLEFEHVFVLRVNSASFPTNYREQLFEFPAALRKSVSAQGDSSEVHRQEERRLFYVAMTRARESLVICTRRGNGKRQRPPVFIGEVLDDPLSRPYRREVTVTPPPAPEERFDIAAAAAPLLGLEAWLLGPPSARLHAPSLSASAVEAYEECPLRFKLERDWNIPGPPGAALEYGKVMHSVLKDHYDALRAGRKRTLAEVLDLFQRELQDAYFDDPHQRHLYCRQGEKQLTSFLAARAQEPDPDVLGTEVSFQVQIGTVPVRGRIDRLDRVEGGLAVVDYKTGSSTTSRTPASSPLRGPRISLPAPVIASSPWQKELRRATSNPIPISFAAATATTAPCVPPPSRSCTRSPLRQARSNSSYQPSAISSQRPRRHRSPRPRQMPLLKPES